MANRDDEDFDWHEIDQMGLWEHQGHPLTLRVQAHYANDENLLDLPIEVTVYNGADASPFLVPLHMDFRGPRDEPAAIVITVSLPSA